MVCIKQNVTITVLIFFEFILIVHSLVSAWGEPCEYSAECTDHRLICDNKTLVCICDRFHEWKGIENGCYPKYNITTIMNMTVESNNALELLEKERNIIFATNLAAGIFVLIMVGSSILAVLAYCICVRRQDGILKDLVKEMQTNRRQRIPHQRFP